MKMHIGVDSRSGLAHSAVVMAANVHDKHPSPTCFTTTNSACMATAPKPTRRQPEDSQKTLMGSKAPKSRDVTNQRVRRGGEIDEVERSNHSHSSSAVFAVFLFCFAAAP